MKSRSDRGRAYTASVLLAGQLAQELYDGQGKKIITYPRAEVRYLPQSLISDVPRIVAGLQVGQSFGAIPVPEPPVIRKGASGTFYDRGREGASRARTAARARPQPNPPRLRTNGHL